MNADAEEMYANTWIYELENKETREDIGFWQRLLEQYQPKRVLELAVGTGRIILPLARRFAAQEVSFVGLDLSAPMIKKGQEKLASEPEAVQQAVKLAVGDMTKLSENELARGPFDLVYIPYNSMAHLQTIDEQLAAFRNAAQVLAPNGHFVVDVFHPNLAQLAASTPPTTVQLDLDLLDPAPGVHHLLRYITRRYIPDIQQERITFIYEQYLSNGQTSKLVSTFDSHAYFPRELELLLRLAGLTITERWGSYAGEPFTETSTQMIFGAMRLAE